jgi:hypothetical protein
MYYCKEKRKARHRVFLWRVLTSSCSSFRANRHATRYMAVALPWNRDLSVMYQGLPSSWFTGPPDTCLLHKTIKKSSGLKKW